MATNLEAMNEQKFFESMGKQIFDYIESAIEYAALCHPDEFIERNDKITELLFAKRQQPWGINIPDDVSEGDSTTRSSEKQRALEKGEGKESETEFDAEVKLPLPHRVPNKSCGVGSEEANIKKAVQVGIVTRKFSKKSGEKRITEKTRVMIKIEKSMDSDLQVKLEASKRKLHEGYKRFEDAKQKKKIQVIESKDLPRGGVPVNHNGSNQGRKKQ